MSASQLSALCALLPALATDIAAGVIADLLAAIPRLPAGHDPATRELTLVRRLAELHPRDLEEAMLAVQFIAASCVATLCAEAAAGLDPVSKEASRLRRDVALQQRVQATLHRALERARARPMLADVESGEVRPTVMPAATATVRRTAAAAQAAEEKAEAAKPWPPDDVFDGHPDLKALNDRWYSLPRWEDMTMEERRQTWGYKPESANAADGARQPAR